MNKIRFSSKKICKGAPNLSLARPPLPLIRQTIPDTINECQFFKSEKIIHLNNSFNIPCFKNELSKCIIFPDLKNCHSIIASGLTEWPLCWDLKKYIIPSNTQMHYSKS